MARGIAASATTRIAGALAGSYLALTSAGCGSSTPASSVSDIVVSPSVCAVGRTTSAQLSAEATLPDGGKEDISSNPGTQWSSDNTNTTTVNETGVVVGVNAGVTKITASFGGATGSVNCTVGP